MSIILETIQSENSVGQFSSHAQVNSQLASAYRDSTYSGLRYAVRTGLDIWADEFVDGGTPDSEDQEVLPPSITGDVNFGSSGFAVTDTWMAVQIDGTGGKVALYKNISGTWSFVKRLSTSDASLSSSSEFGKAIALSHISDDHTLVIGGDGNVSVFYQHEGGTDNWGHIQNVSDPITTNGQFGNSLALHEKRLVIGDWGVGTGGLTEGRVYGFVGTAVGNRVTFPSTPDDTLIGTNSIDNGRFGFSVDVQNSFLIVGATNESTGGLVYIFEETTEGVWTETTSVSGSTTAASVFRENVSLACSVIYSIVSERSSYYKRTI